MRDNEISIYTVGEINNNQWPVHNVFKENFTLLFIGVYLYNNNIVICMFYYKKGALLICALCECIITFTQFGKVKK